MAPRKINSKNSNDTPQCRNTRGRSKKTQSPMSIEIQIPAKQSDDITKDKSPKEITRRRTKRCNLPLERQIELANEVIHTQLARKVTIKSNPDMTEKVQFTIVGSMPVLNDNEVDNKAPVRKMIRNRQMKTATISRPQITRKRSADSTQEPAKQRKISQKTVAAEKPKKETKSTAPTKGNTQKKRTIQGKKKLCDVSAVQNSLPSLDAIENTEVKEPTAAVIDSRKTSSTSASNFSWTKDISNSSTTTCVTVSTNDFVRIDNKIPIIQLTNVDSELQKYKRSDINDSSSDSDSSSASDSASNVSIDVQDMDLNLSTSSSSVCKANINSTPKSDSVKGITMSKALCKLSSVLKNFDKEIVKWIGYGEEIDDANKKCNDTILRVLNEESIVISSCRQLIRIFSDKEPDDVDTDGESKPVVTNNFNVSFDDDNPITKDNVLLNENVEYPRSPKSPSTTYDSDYAFDNFKNMSFDRNNDDDDALSLFAESITGIEPCRTDDPCESPDVDDLEQDEYVPQRLSEDTNKKTEKYDYCPTKITNTNVAVKKNVCEKQNADSTSISKEGNIESIPRGDVERCSGQTDCDGQIEEGELAATEVLPNQIGPPQVTSIFQKVPRIRTTIFKDMCFFNLINACKKAQYCAYPHVVPNPVEMITCLMRLSEEMFIEEYIFMSSYAVLRRVYGFYFVEECHRRGMLRTLVEMALDFVVNFVVKNKEDADCQLSILEYILLSLNDVGLTVCEDLLDSPVDSDTRLCHIFMRVIANSLNFSRFKQVFLSLTDLMVRLKRTFDLDVTEQILERVCILPTDERLIRAVFNIIKLTDVCVFENSMMCIFELKLETVNSAMYEELTALKNEKGGTAAASKHFSFSPAKGKDLEPLKINCINDNERESYTSPDTTKAETLQNKPAFDISTTRTVNLRRTCYNNKFSSTPTKRTDNWSNNFHSWRQRSPRPAPVPLLSIPVMRPTTPLNSRKVQMYRMPSTVCKEFTQAAGDVAHSIC